MFHLSLRNCIVTALQYWVLNEQQFCRSQIHVSNDKSIKQNTCRLFLQHAGIIGRKLMLNVEQVCIPKLEAVM
jgi:hypothetical protein